jgi:hypothetical protein
MPKGKRGFQKGNRLGKKFQAGDKHWNWHGGIGYKYCGNKKTMYRLLKVPWHPDAYRDGYVLEHRYVMEQALGRLLAPWEVVHHKDGNGLNNDVDNLQLFQDGITHSLYHKRMNKLKRGKTHV